MEGNEEILMLYRYLGGSCFKTDGMSGITFGFDWPGVKVVADAVEIPLNHDVMDGLKVIEAEALKYLNKKAKA